MKNLLKIAAVTAFSLGAMPSCSNIGYRAITFAPCFPIDDNLEIEEIYDQPTTIIPDSIQTSKDRKFNEELNRIRGYSDPDGVKVNIPFMRF
ncbi:MAG: hypothetical protein Q7R52_04305 [archaeon]|nr:hypothetical protein [archaeon]